MHFSQARVCILHCLHVYQDADVGKNISCLVKENSIFGMCCQVSEASLDIDAVGNWDV